MKARDVEHLSIATIVAGLLSDGWTPAAALHEAHKLWSEIELASRDGLAADAEVRADYERVFVNLYAGALAGGLTPDAALEHAKRATSVLLCHLDPDYIDGADNGR